MVYWRQPTPKLNSHKEADKCVAAHALNSGQSTSDQRARLGMGYQVRPAELATPFFGPLKWGNSLAPDLYTSPEWMVCCSRFIQPKCKHQDCSGTKLRYDCSISNSSPPHWQFSTIDNSSLIPPQPVVADSPNLSFGPLKWGRNQKVVYTTPFLGSVPLAWATGREGYTASCERLPEDGAGRISTPHPLA